MKRIAFAAFFALVVLLSSARSDAGAQYNSFSCWQKYLFCFGSCFWMPAGCSGSFAAARNSADPKAYAEFTQSASGAYSFSAYYNSTQFSCTANATLQQMWSTAMSNRGYFGITWDDSSTCTALQVTNGSRYSSY
jgi:hypothetical protein